MNGFKDKELRFKILEEIFEKPKYIIFLENLQKLFILIIFKDYGDYICSNFIEYSTKDLQFLHNEIPQRFAQGQTINYLIIMNYLKIT